MSTRNTRGGTADLMEKLCKQSEKDQAALQSVLAAVEAGDSAQLQAALKDGGQAVVKSGAPVRGSGALPLQQAAAAGKAELVQMLLDAGAPLDAADGKGLTPLQVRIIQRSRRRRSRSTWVFTR